MLLEFSVKNFKSIKSLQTLSLVASSAVSKDPLVDENNITPISNNLNLLKSICIYGANASGKSNIIKALGVMFNFIEKSFKDKEYSKKAIQPFLLDKVSKNKPTFFQIIFLIDKDLYRYGFEVKGDEIISEWLFGPAAKNEVYYFVREKDNIKVNPKSFVEGKGLQNVKAVSGNLYLNVVDAFKGSISSRIKKYFDTTYAICAGTEDIFFRNNTTIKIKDEFYHKKVIEFLKVADFGIDDIDKIVVDKKDLPKDLTIELRALIVDDKFDLIVTKRNIYNSKGQIIDILLQPFDTFESEGTKKYLNLIGSILTSITEGKTLIVDELDSKLHPLLTRKILQLYNSKEHNKKGAQLIFATHDTNLLDSGLQRRDQIYFSEKSIKGESRFYSLVNIKGVRNDASFGKDYIKGKYGAIPFLGKFNIA